MDNRLYEAASEFASAGLRIFPLHRFEKGVCECGNKNCKAVGKHPARDNWTHSPVVDSAVVETWTDGDFMPPYVGMGWALDACHIVVDVDPRNGGTASFEQLQKDIGIDLREACSAVVKTGGGGLHLYFAKPEDQDLCWKMPAKYVGIDIKQGGGFVVIPGSLHASGNYYEWESFSKSSIDELTYIPEPLARLLARPKVDHLHINENREFGDLNSNDIADMLSYLDPDMEHDEWIKVGMAVYRATDGAGFDIWDGWSSNGAKYDPRVIEVKWKSFDSRPANAITIATLVDMAKRAGWEFPIKLGSVHADDEWIEGFPEELKDQALKAFENWGKKAVSTKREITPVDDFIDVDLMQPPGKIKQLLDYVRNSSPFDNRNLSLAAALYGASCVVGRSCKLDGKHSRVTPNLMLLVIADAATGKESALNAGREILRHASLTPAVAGRIKSDKDLLDSLELNQYSFYMIDEFGGFLQRVASAKKTGGASYLEGVPFTMMEVFTKTNGVLSTDSTRLLAFKEKLSISIRKVEQYIEDKGGPNCSNYEEWAGKAEYLRNLAKRVDEYGGAVKPWFSLYATATPNTMKNAFDRDSVESGFLSRALVFQEYESNPRPKPNFIPVDSFPNDIKDHISRVMFARPSRTAGRIDDCDDVKPYIVRIDDDARDYLDRYSAFMFERAEALKELGLTPLARRAQEMALKLCLTIAGYNRTSLTLEVARYGCKIASGDLDLKIRRVRSSIDTAALSREEKQDSLHIRMLEACHTPQTDKGILNSCRIKGLNLEIIRTHIKHLVEKGYLEKTKTQRKKEAFICTEAGKNSMDN